LIVVIEQGVASDTGGSRGLLRRSVRPAAWLAPFLLSVGSSALAALTVVGAEMAARRCAPDYLVETRGVYVFSETYGWAPRAGASAVIDGKRTSFNEGGYRGRELALRRARDRTRVIVLGDSIAFGLDVSDDETFTHLLDARDNGIEAGNLAVQGYGPGQELLVLMNEGLRRDPDVVILTFCLDNDFAESVLPVSLYDGRTPKPRFQLAGDRLVLDDSSLRLSAWRRTQQWLSDYSHLFNRVAALDSRSGAPPAAGWRDRKREALRDGESTLRLNVAIVRRMDALCRERGIAFILAAFPNGASYRSKPWLANRFLESVQAEGITVVDMAARFVALGQPFRTVSLDRIGHLSPLGHTIACQVLESEIASHTHVPIATLQNRPRDGTPDVNDRIAPRSPRNGAAAR
jgi:hypothetical protein